MIVVPMQELNNTVCSTTGYSNYIELLNSKSDLLLDEMSEAGHLVAALCRVYGYRGKIVSRSEAADFTA